MRVQKIHLPKGSDVPNSPLPVVIYRGALGHASSGKADAFRKCFAKNRWAGIWTDTIFDYLHFHSNAHEVLGVATGAATLRIGGAAGRLVRLRAGDVIVLPAGTGHQRLGDDKGLKVIGAYPSGQSHYTMKRPGKTRIHAQPRVTLPETDPFYGAEGPLTKIWEQK